MKRLLIFCLAICCSSAAQAQLYRVETISAELKADVDWVMREDVMRWRIYAPDRATSKVHYVATVLNSNANDIAEVSVFYDKLEKITDLKVTVYDAAGLVIRKVKNSEIRDVSLVDGVSLFSDNRMKYVDVSQSTYPYTLEVEYEKEYKYLFNNMSSAMLSGTKMSCENFLFEITYLPNLAPRYRVVNHNVKVKEVQNNDGTVTISWETHALKPIKPEPHGPTFDEIYPGIVAAPSIFAFSGYSGKMNSWDDYNAWILSVNKGRDQIPRATQLKVKELTKDL